MPLHGCTTLLEKATQEELQTLHLAKAPVKKSHVTLAILDETVIDAVPWQT